MLGMKTTYARDGWNGPRFKRARKAEGRSVAWLAARTAVCVDTVNRYESDRTFPPHRWRDAAALVLNLERSDLGMPGGAK